MQRDPIAREGLTRDGGEVMNWILDRHEYFGRPGARGDTATHNDRVCVANARDERQTAAGDAGALQINVVRRRIELHETRLSISGREHPDLDASLLHRKRGDRRLVPVDELVRRPCRVNVLRVHVTVFEDEISFDRFDARRFQIVRPFVDHRGGVIVVKAAADGRIAVTGDFHVAGERAARIDVAAHEHRGGELEIGMKQIDRGGSREQLHVRCRRERKMRIVLGDRTSGIDFHHGQTGVRIPRRRAVHQRGEPLFQSTTDSDFCRRSWSGASAWPPSRAFFLRVQIGWQSNRQHDRKQRYLPHSSARLQFQCEYLCVLCASVVITISEMARVKQVAADRAE